MILSPDCECVFYIEVFEEFVNGNQLWGGLKHYSVCKKLGMHAFSLNILIGSSSSKNLV